MKSTLLTTILIALFFTSCDKVDEITEVTLNETFTEEVVIALSEDNPEVNGAVLINLASNSDLAPYLNKVEDIQITEIFYSLKQYNGLEEGEGTLTATAASQTFGPFEHPFFEDSQTAKKYTLSGGSKISAIATALKNNKRLTVAFTGVQNPVQNGSFKVVVTVKLRVIAEAL